MNLTIFCGEFDADKGRPSSYCNKLFTEVIGLLKPSRVLMQNGGNVELLKPARFDSDVIFWFPSVSNDVPKHLRDIKVVNPFSLLVSSKANYDARYKPEELVHRALVSKSNLLVEFRKTDKIEASVWDPLGNCFTSQAFFGGPLKRWHDNTSVLALLLTRRIQELLSYKRVGSKFYSVVKPLPARVPDQFLSLAREHAQVYHRLIHTQNAERFLGNLSFRCTYGFPSFRGETVDGPVYYVSKRNLDKRNVGIEDFVPLRPREDVVEFYGGEKPSVDAPLHVRLYNHFRNVNFILHSHVYIKDAPFTRRVIPCGAVEEFEEILAICNNPAEDSFCVNLRGHGSVALVSNPRMLEQLMYYVRPMPEIQLQV